MRSFCVIIVPVCCGPVLPSPPLQPWRDYFDDTPEARQNLFELQQGSDTCEFFYFPFMLPDDLYSQKVTMIDTVRGGHRENETRT
jgi:hypothetical protein